MFDPMDAPVQACLKKKGFANQDRHFGIICANHQQVKIQKNGIIAVY